MKPFKFSLQRLLNYKENVLDKEKNTLAALRAEQRRVVDQIEYTETQYSRLSNEIRRISSKGVLAIDVQQIQYKVDACTYRLRELEVEKEAIDARVEEQLQIVLELIKENKQLDKLKDRQLEEYRMEEVRENSEIISEFVSRTLICEKTV
ncbi:MAG: hypothetical protein GX257_01005 [Clostridiales bacterium]|jgi:flagellar FliJ protein|nr:hypothetical protein [Clostridiales bacterium]